MSMIYIYQKLIKRGVHVCIYSRKYLLDKEQYACTCLAEEKHKQSACIYLVTLAYVRLNKHLLLTRHGAHKNYLLTLC